MEDQEQDFAMSSKSGKTLNIILIIVIAVILGGGAAFYFLVVKKDIDAKTAQIQNLQKKVEKLEYIVEVDSLAEFISFRAENAKEILKNIEDDKKDGVIIRQKFALRTMREAVSFRDSLIKLMGND